MRVWVGLGLRVSAVTIARLWRLRSATVIKQLSSSDLARAVRTVLQHLKERQ